MVRIALLTFALSLSALTVASSISSNNHNVRFTRRSPSTSKYPPINQTPPESSLPQEWITALNDAVAAGKIPDIPNSTETADGNVKYPSGSDGNGNEICSWTISKCNGADDITDAPDGEWTIAFDDGPTAASPTLYKFLQDNGQRGTHFMIGSQIKEYPDEFQQAIASNQEVAVHTWSHSLLTTRDNLGVVAELGWNMQIIYDKSGRVPKLYRPPQGDLDNRVRAIAKELFGLTAVMWNAECNDWCLDADGSSECPGEVPGESRKTVASAIQKALNRSKSPGVSILEHELNTITIGLFTDYYPQLATLGWKPQAVSDHYGQDWYANAKDNTDTAFNVTSMLYKVTSAANSSDSSTSSSTSSIGSAKQSSVASSSSGTARLSTSMLFTVILTGLTALLIVR